MVFDLACNLSIDVLYVLWVIVKKNKLFFAAVTYFSPAYIQPNSNHSLKTSKHILYGTTCSAIRIHQETSQLNHSHDPNLISWPFSAFFPETHRI